MLDKQPIAAYEDSAFAGEARHLTSTTFIGHVRKASTGAPAPQNTHPFAMEGRIMAHNGAIGDLPKLEQQLGDHLALVQGDTDSERMFALITSCTERHGGDVSAGIADAAAWLAANIPIYAINLILTTPDGLWALRYPETHELYVLEREAGGTHGSRPLHASSDTMRVHSEHLSRHPAVLLRKRAAGRASRLAAARRRRAAARGRRPDGDVADRARRAAGHRDGRHLPAPGGQRAVSRSPAYVETPRTGARW